jgi:osmotically-inducible protein OsmY
VLRGEVPSEDLRVSAERIASGVPDAGSVRNEIRVNPAMPAAASTSRSVGETIDDRALEAKVRLAYSLHRGMDGSDVSVAVYRGAVTLSGTVASDAQRALALQLARDASGAASVTDRLAAQGGAAKTSSRVPATAAGPAGRIADIRSCIPYNRNVRCYAGLNRFHL